MDVTDTKYNIIKAQVNTRSDENSRSVSGGKYVVSDFYNISLTVIYFTYIYTLQ